jgi:hypothetical protein
MPHSEQLDVLVLGSEIGGKLYGLAHGGIGTTDCRRRERLGWRLMSKHRLYAEQE